MFQVTIPILWSKMQILSICLRPAQISRIRIPKIPIKARFDHVGGNGGRNFPEAIPLFSGVCLQRMPSKKNFRPPFDVIHSSNK